jgi:hypothetical protein
MHAAGRRCPDRPAASYQTRGGNLGNYPWPLSLDVERAPSLRHRRDRQRELALQEARLSTPSPDPTPGGFAQVGAQAPPARAAPSLVRALRDARGALLCTTWTSRQQPRSAGVKIGRRSRVKIRRRLTPNTVPVMARSCVEALEAVSLETISKIRECRSETHSQCISPRPHGEVPQAKCKTLQGRARKLLTWMPSDALADHGLPLLPVFVNDPAESRVKRGPIAGYRRSRCAAFLSAQSWSIFSSYAS